jgi:hypothetical protein
MQKVLNFKSRKNLGNTMLEFIAEQSKYYKIFIRIDKTVVNKSNLN